MRRWRSSPAHLPCHRFNATDTSGFPTGAGSLTGGGSYNSETGSPSRLAASAAHRRRPGPTGRSPHGEGVRRDTVAERAQLQVHRATAERLKTAITDENAIVFPADFYRAGDGNDESFIAGRLPRRSCSR